MTQHAICQRIDRDLLADTTRLQLHTSFSVEHYIEANGLCEPTNTTARIVEPVTLDGEVMPITLPDGTEYVERGVMLIIEFDAD